jgi:cholesterol transport system auxiliary component
MSMALPRVLGLALLLAAGGCQNLFPGSDRPAPRLYELTPKSTFAPDLPRVSAQLVVETPEAAAGLQTGKIAVKQQATTLDYFARSEWSDLAPRLVQTKMIESFENTQKIVSVGREGSGLRSDFILKSELRHFEAQLYDTDVPIARVVVNVKLVRMPDRAIVANRSFERTSKAKSAAIEDVVEAFDDALGGALKRLCEWTIREIAKRHRGAAPARPTRDTGDD